MNQILNDELVADDSISTATAGPRSRTGRVVIAALAAGALLLAACGGSDSTDAAADEVTTTVAETTTTEEAMEEEAMEEDGMEEDGMEEDGDAMAGGELEPSGAACSAVPTDGEGSFAGMADDTAATAASNNPVLSTLVSAVVAADLVDTLNSDGPFTIFAPTNDAFAAIPADQLDAVLADTELLTSILTFHVIAGEKMSSADLIEAGTATTVNGASLTFAADGEAVSVNGAASTVCADVPTANATVHIIDSVLLPG